MAGDDSGRIVQSLVFPRAKFSPSDARDWAKKHGFAAGKVDVQTNTIRLRQVAPSEVRKGSYRTEKRAGGVQVVWAAPKAAQAVRRNPRGRRPCAGLALVREGSLLLVEDWNGKLSIPKGVVEEGETYRQAAIREVGEETGILVRRNRLGPGGRVCSLRWWSVDVEYDELPAVLPTQWLQAAEVSWAGFVPVETAWENIEEWQLPVLDRLSQLL